MRGLDLDKPNEGIDYDLEAVSHGGDAMWNVNIYRAPYNNVTIRYRNVVINEEMGGINFNFDVIDTPDESVYNVENVELQGFAADILQDIIERLASKTEGSNDGNQSSTDDS
jgi:hypothetical protein